MWIIPKGAPSSPQYCCVLEPFGSNSHSCTGHTYIFPDLRIVTHTFSSYILSAPRYGLYEQFVSVRPLNTHIHAFVQKTQFGSAHTRGLFILWVRKGTCQMFLIDLQSQLSNLFWVKQSKIDPCEMIVVGVKDKLGQEAAPNLELSSITISSFELWTLKS